MNTTGRTNVANPTPSGGSPRKGEDTESIEDLVSPEQKKEKRFAVIEVFGPTVQGEGPLAGSKTMFVRFGGCDYRCAKCDSLHAVIPAAVKANAEYLTAQDIADRLIPKAKETGTPWVTLSGGNPAMWDLSELVRLLHEADLGVAVETQGTLYQPWIAACQMVVVSPKSPGMGEKFEPVKLNKFLTELNSAWRQREFKHKIPAGVVALKVVIFAQQDIEFAIHVTDVLAQHNTMVHPGLMFLSLGNASPPKLDDANHLQDTISWSDQVLQLLQEYRLLVEDICNDPRITHYKFLPQLHVLTFGNEAER